ncbi:MAG TPA: hypothetical protein PKK10_06860 [Woeseiaceae bacterium]|nr:hypothetical protein [Woeseiaceae bacterium]
MKSQRLLPLLVLLPLIQFLASCSKTLPPEFSDVATLAVPTSGESLAPKLTTGSNGQLLMSWLEKGEDGGTLKVSQFRDGAWQPATTVVGEPEMFVNWADLPSVTALDDKHWVAHWLSSTAAGPYAYNISVAQSFDAGTSWTDPIEPHTDGTASEHGFVSVYKHADGAGMVWLDGRKTVNTPSKDPLETGMSLRAATVTGDGTLRNEQVIDDLVCDCCQTDIAVSSSGPVAAYRNRTDDEIRDIYVSLYRDGKWQAGTPVANDGWQIAGCPVNGPAVAAAADFVAISWFTAAHDAPMVRASISKDGGRSFNEPVLISDDIPAGHVDIAYVGNSVFAVSWLSDAAGDNTIKLRALSLDGTLGKVSTVGASKLSRNVPQMAAFDDKLILAWAGLNGDESDIVSVSVMRGR